MDPRADKRFSLQDRSIDVKLRKISQATLQGIIYEKILIVREINFGTNEELEANSGPDPQITPPSHFIGTNDQTQSPNQGFTYVAKDACFDITTKKIHPEFLALLKRGPDITARLLDCSRGGLGLNCKAENTGIPPGSIYLFTGLIPLVQKKAFDFSLIGIVRGANQWDNGLHLHIMFVKSLPKRFEEIMQNELTNT